MYAIDISKSYRVNAAYYSALMRMRDADYFQSDPQCHYWCVLQPMFNCRLALSLHDKCLKLELTDKYERNKVMPEIRLQKYMAEAGVASRRKSEELILQGRVEVNGNVVTVPGTKIDGTEIIKVDGKVIEPEENKVYILLNKPVGYISSARDQFERKTVLDLVSNVKERIYPVGRLDYDTSGLILLTNDGELANRMTHPKHEMPKVYRAIIKGVLSQSEISALQAGVIIEDYKTAPAIVKVISEADNNSTVDITIHEGRNRQVRKMFETIGHIVLRLKRIAIGPIKINGLEEGKWRRLDQKEITALRKVADM